MFQRTCLTMFLIALVGCGGGTSSTTNPSNPSTGQTTTGQAQGVYAGTSSNGYAFESVVLPDDKYYALYGTSTSTAFLVSGLMTGQGSSANGSYTATVNDFYYTGQNATGSLKATYSAGSSMNGTITEGGTTISFNGSSMPSSQFSFNTPANLSSITGTWRGTFFDGTSGSLSISSSGAFTGNNLNCTFSGTISPDAARNFFNVTVKFGGSPCLLPNQSATGIGITYLLTNGVTRQLVLGGATSTAGTVFFAVR